MRKTALILLLAVIMFNTSGCWDAKDLGTLALPFAAAYDKDGNNITVTSIGPNLSNEAPKKYSLVVLRGMTVGDTRNRRSEQVPRNLLVGMLRLGLFGEDMAGDAEAMRRTMDLFLRSPQVPSYASMAVTEGSAMKILSTPTEDYENTAVLIIDLLRIAPRNYFIPQCNFHEFGVSSVVKGENPVLPLLKLQNKKVVIAGSAIFKHFKLIAKLNKKETRSIVLLRGDKPTGYIPFIIQREGRMIDKGTVLVNGSRKVSVQRQGDEYNFKIKITLNGSLIEHSNPDLLLEKPEHLSEIEKQLEANMEHECRNFIAKMQTVYGLDCIDISGYALAKWRPELQNVIENRDFIENMKIDVEVKVNINNIGELT